MKSLKEIKVALLLGRGCEACGITMCALQIQRAFPNCRIFFCNDKRWGREKAHVYRSDTVAFKVGDDAQMEAAAKEFSTYDLVIVMSTPSKSHPHEAQVNFFRLLEKINTKISLVNLDHKSQSISRNAFYNRCCAAVDVLLTHSLENAFCQYIKKHEINIPIKKMRLGFDYDAHRVKYWKPIEEQDSRIVRWIGRLSGWKGPNIMTDFHEHHLVDLGMITCLEGLEASISWKDIVYDKEKNGHYVHAKFVINYFRSEKPGWKFSDDLYTSMRINSGAYLFPPYNNHDCMERMSRSGFGSDLYHLPAEFYGDNIENCHAEIVGCGAVPIFHKHFAENIKHVKTGNVAARDENTGTLFLDTDSFEECARSIIRLKDDNVLRNEWREMAFEYWKAHSNIHETAEEILKTSYYANKITDRKPILELQEFRIPWEQDEEAVKESKIKSREKMRRMKSAQETQETKIEEFFE